MPRFPESAAAFYAALSAALLLMGCLSSVDPGSSRPAPSDTTGTPSGWKPPDPLILDLGSLPALPADPADPADTTHPVNSITAPGVALGARLFRDRILSEDNTISCADCHRPAHAFSDSGRAYSLGVHGRQGAKNAPALANLAWAPRLFWDGRAASLEDQALHPVRNPDEMNLPWAGVEARLNRDTAYRRAFREVFGIASIDSPHVVRALAQYERTLISKDSRYDRWKAGEVDFTESEYRGYAIFNSEAGECFHCHGEPLFTNFGFRNIGLDSAIEGTGLGARTGQAADMGKWKVPSLRNIGFTAPYMHDGRFATLGEVLDFYQSGGHYSATLDPLIRNVENPYAKYPGRQGLGLTDAQRADLLAFLATLDDSAFVARHSDP